MSESFGFTIAPVRVYDTASGTLRASGPGWRVYLPHQCESWDIAGEAFDGVPHAEAVAALERFIAEAQVALARLRSAGDPRKAAST